MTSLDLLCLDCSTPLAAAVVDPSDACGCARCACGLRYSPDLIEQADRDEWERVRTTRRFVRDGDTLIVSTTPSEEAM